MSLVFVLTYVLIQIETIKKKKCKFYCDSAPY